MYIRRAHRAAAVTFLIGAPHLDPVHVTGVLGITPTQVAIPGQRLETLDGRVVHVDHVGWWALDTTGIVKSGEVADHFRYLLEQVEPHVAVLAELAAGGEILFEVPWAPERASEFDAECTRRAEALGAHIDFLGERDVDSLGA